MTLKAIQIRMALIPPAVEPAEPPTNMSSTSVALAANGHVSKLAVVYPVVVAIDAVVNTPYRIADPVPTGIASPVTSVIDCRSRHSEITVAPPTSRIRYVRSSGSRSTVPYRRRSRAK